jgi:hypothetical protein
VCVERIRSSRLFVAEPRPIIVKIPPGNALNTDVERLYFGTNFKYIEIESTLTKTNSGTAKRLVSHEKKALEKSLGKRLPIKIPPRYKATEEKYLDSFKDEYLRFAIKTKTNAPNIGPRGMFNIYPTHAPAIPTNKVRRLFLILSFCIIFKI